MTLALEVVGITKRFPGVLANDGVDFQLAKGEVHALLGENGAGKTTLMDILFGLLRPDEGEIRVNGQTCHLRSPLDALARGIGMVHQHFKLVPNMTVAENIMLGHEPMRGPFLDPRAARRRIEQVSTEFGLAVDASRLASSLSVGEQQRVEMLKVLCRGAEILILDEPTAVITPPEAEALFCTLATMRQRGKSVVFISHKLPEVMAISDRVTVMHRGRVVGTVDTASTDEKALARMMVGRDVVLPTTKSESSTAILAPVVAMQGVRVLGDRRNLAVQDFDLEVHAGEIFGIAGVDGNGQTELAEMLAGLRKPVAGSVLLGGEPAQDDDARRRIECGVRYVPADRHARGCVPDLPVRTNAVLKTHSRLPFSRWGVLNHRAIDDYANGLVRDYDIRCPSLRAPARTLSGGNMQKLILARETACHPRLLIVEHPTRGLDVSATEYVREALLRQAAEGAAILLISADLDEVLALSDRMAVMFAGRLVYQAERREVDIDQLGLAMAGMTHRGENACAQ